jgi:hypothetical protein
MVGLVGMSILLKRWDCFSGLFCWNPGPDEPDKIEHLRTDREPASEINVG